MRKYYTEQAWLEKAKLASETPPEILQELSRSWKQLFAEVEAAIELDPASEAAQSLAQRWLLLLDATTGSNHGIRAGGINAREDHENWQLAQQDSFLSAYGLDTANRTESMCRFKKVGKFIRRAIGRRALPWLGPWGDPDGPK